MPYIFGVVWCWSACEKRSVGALSMCLVVLIDIIIGWFEIIIRVFLEENG